MKKIRLDTLLVEQGYFADADAALRAVLAHEVKVGDVYATSAAVRVAPDAEVVVKNRKRFVSRGGHKLQGALDAFGQDVRGLRCLDIGSSTGGFSDCLLQAGAASVACVDVNYGQLAWKLRQDPRVSVFERVNIKLADPVEFVLAHAFAWNSCGGIRRAIESFIARIRLLSQRQHSERYNNKSHQGKQNHQHERFQRQQPFIRGRAQNPGHHYVADEPRRHFGQNTADKKQWYGRDPSLFHC